MDLFKDLLDENKWNSFLMSKIESNYLSPKEIKEFKDFITEKKYLDICESIIKNEYEFSIPKKIVINKIGKNKKRIVYMFNEDEVIILKYINYLLYDYDYMFSSNLYSFRKNKSVKDAINGIQRIHNLDNMYAYKVDISNYFNSVPIDRLLVNLKNEIDENTYNLFNSILSNNKVIYNKKVIEEEKGIMAGVPISSFLANYYLKDMDRYFENNNIKYFRYADDILVLSNNIEELIEYKNDIHKYLIDSGLNINPDKEYIFNPKESVEFLGFEINGRIVDISKMQLKKIKGKIKRSARKFRRWKLEKNVEDIPTLVTMNKKFNNKFYGKEDDELSWRYYFFPLINTTDSLHEIDLYMQECQRYVVTGVHNKKNYEKVPYDFLKKCKYKSLVHEYYEFIQKNVK